MNSNIIEYITDKAIFADGVKSKVFTLLNYLETQQNEHYYPLTKIKNITNLSTSSSMEVARFFCSPAVSLLEPKFIYITFEGQSIEITKADFNNGLRFDSLNQGSDFITEENEKIEGFDRRRLKFFFIRKVEAEYEELEW
ncbi:hypothetical protein OA39_02480 [Vibrio campbellii]|nr:hypothetical protein [Vibrio parahaemolyticus]KGR35543.1 hypothetical protein OA39_02480 [Vibrio campbellii]OQU27840.1 hypothetical protein EN05_020645 [Vibrio parahaemolyticus]